MKIIEKMLSPITIFFFIRKSRNRYVKSSLDFCKELCIDWYCLYLYDELLRVEVWRDHRRALIAEHMQ